MENSSKNKINVTQHQHFFRINSKEVKSRIIFKICKKTIVKTTTTSLINKLLNNKTFQKTTRKVYLIPIWKLKRRTIQSKGRERECGRNLMSRNTQISPAITSHSKLNWNLVILIQWNSKLPNQKCRIIIMENCMIQKIFNKLTKDMRSLSVKSSYKKNNW